MTKFKRGDLIISTDSGNPQWPAVRFEIRKVIAYAGRRKKMIWTKTLAGQRYFTSTIASRIFNSTRRDCPKEYRLATDKEIARAIADRMTNETHTR